MKAEAKTTVPAAKSLWTFINNELEVGKMFTNIDKMITDGGPEWLKTVIEFFKGIFKGVGK